MRLSVFLVRIYFYSGVVYSGYFEFWEKGKFFFIIFDFVVGLRVKLILDKVIEDNVSYV